MRKEKSVRTFLEEFDSGKYSKNDFDTQCKAGWYDWFCNDSALRGKTYKLVPKIKRLSKSNKIDIDSMYIFFKNNCPMIGKLYDDFRFCDIKSGEVIYTIIPSCGHEIKFKKSEVWGKENNFKEAIVSGTWKDVLNYFEV